MSNLLTLRTRSLAAILLPAALLLVSAWLLLRNPAPAGQRIYYLSWDQNEIVQLYQLELDRGEPRQMTQAGSSLLDFALSADGAKIAYSAGDGENGSGLWLTDAGGRDSEQLVACPEALCSAPVWHPDGRRLVFERRDLRDDGTLSGEPRLYWLDSDSGESIPLFEDSQGISQAASFSPDGAWISYAGSADEGIIAYNLESGEEVQFESEMGTAAVWSPDSQQLIIRNHYLVSVHGDEGEDHLSHSHDFALGIYLFAADINAGTAKPISGDVQVDDSAPAWSPDGTWIAFSRKLPRTQTGRQLWLIRPDGSEARALTDDLSVHHGVPAWSPDGQQLIFQRVEALSPDARPQIWAYDLALDQMRQLTSAGFKPQFSR